VLSHFDNEKYSIMNNASPVQLFSFEFVAVFLFTFTFCSAVNEGEVDTQAAGAILLVIALTTSFCGANLNPVVTLANCVKR
jgi:glycerol uptake facilitator-like aquaporin